MPRALFNGTVIAETDSPKMVEGNVYFPPEAIKREFFKESRTRTICIWKGEASYYDVEVDGQRAEDAAWYYPDTKAKADHIKGHVAFYSHLVDVEF